MNSEQLEQTLLQVQDPFLKKSLGELSFELQAGKLIFKMPYFLNQEQRQFLEKLVQQATGYQALFETKIKTHAVAKNLKPLKQVKNIIAVASGKGGVGKSTVSVGIAKAMQNLGAKVAILDADIYGPNVPVLMGLDGNPKSTEQGLEPIYSPEGIAVMSMAFLVDSQTALIWRGPMVTQALQQLFEDTIWPELDYLFIDMPPGTGDVQLSISQHFPVSGVILISTPHQAAVLDTTRAAQMFQKVNLPILGLVENMSYLVCPNCSHQHLPFAQQQKVETLAQQIDVPVLQELPLDRELSNQYFDPLASKVSAALARQSLDQVGKFPEIVIR